MISSAMFIELIGAHIAKTLSYSLNRSIQERQVIMDEFLRRKADAQYTEDRKNPTMYLRNFPRLQ